MSLPTGGDRPLDSGLFSVRFGIVHSTSANGQARNPHFDFFTDD